MGIYDRDYMRDKAKFEREQDVHRASFSEQDIPSSLPRTAKPWHWSLITLFWVFVVILLTAAFKFMR